MDTNISNMIKFDKGVVNILHALQSKWYGTQWVGNGITYDGIEWLDTNEILKPSEVEIDAEVVRLQAEYDAQEYARNRIYPAIGDQLDMLWHAIDTGDWTAAKVKTTDFYTKLKKVKDDNPKPS